MTTREILVVSSMYASIAGIVACIALMYWYNACVINCLKRGLAAYSSPSVMAYNLSMIDRFRRLRMYVMYVLLGWICTTMVSVYLRWLS